MSEWKEVTLGEISNKVTSGGTPSTKKQEFYNGNIPWLNTKEINFNRIRITDKTISQAGLKNSSAKWIDENSIIIAMYGATAAKVAINKIPLTTNQACCNLTINDRLADYNFVFYSVWYNYKKLENISVGAAQQNLSVKVISNFPILLPPLLEQKAIAEVLSSLDDKIDLLHRQNQTLEKMAETLFRQWLIEEESELITLGECIKTASGGTPSRKRMDFYENGIYQWIKSKELNGGYILDTEERITEEALNKSSAKLLPENSVLIAMYGATVGEFAIIGQEATCNQAICACIPNNKFPYTFIYHTIKANVDELKNRAVGSAQQNISQILIKSMEISVNDNIDKFHTEVDPMMQRIKTNCKQIRILERLRNTLLLKLMSGEVSLRI